MEVSGTAYWCDLKFGRTVSSLTKLLQFYELHVEPVSPKVSAILRGASTTGRIAGHYGAI